MAIHYQVIANFKCSRCKPQLVKISYCSTFKACTSFPFLYSKNSYLTISRIFQTLQAAEDYIAYLKRLYPDSHAPVFEGGQKDLFSDGTIEEIMAVTF